MYLKIQDAGLVFTITTTTVICVEIVNQAFVSLSFGMIEKYMGGEVKNSSVKLTQIDDMRSLKVLPLAWCDAVSPRKSIHLSFF